MNGLTDLLKILYDERNPEEEKSNSLTTPIGTKVTKSDAENLARHIQMTGMNQSQILRLALYQYFNSYDAYLHLRT